MSMIDKGYADMNDAKFKLEMLRAYIRGALSLESAPGDRFMQGYDAGMRAIRDYLDRMERPIEDEDKEVA